MNERKILHKTNDLVSCLNKNDTNESFQRKNTTGRKTP